MDSLIEKISKEICQYQQIQEYSKPCGCYPANCTSYRYDYLAVKIIDEYGKEIAKTIKE